MKKLVSLLLVAVICVSLVACGGAKTDATTPTTAPAATTDNSNAPAPTQEEPTTSGPVSGGEINIPITDDPTTLQGWMVRNTNEGTVAPAIYETLLAYDNSGIPQPYLLESFEGNAEALTYTLVVKEGITFQDGTPLDAEAVKWNLDYYKENGVLTGSYFKDVDSVEVVDDKTVVIHMANWDALFNYGLARTCFICSPTAVEKLGADGFNETPVGTGPFKVTKWVHGEGIYTEAYADYWQGKPYLDAVNFKIYASTATQQAAMEVGDLDIMYLTGDAVTADSMEAKGYKITTAAIPDSGHTLCFNSKAEGPLTDVRVRQAIALAVDVESINAALLSGGKYGTSSTQWAVSTSGEYFDIEGYGYDVDKAKSLLAEAGYEDGFDLTINFQVGDFAKSVCQIIQAELGEIGINVTLNQIEVANYANYLGEWDGILYHPMGLSNGQYSQISANMIPGARFGSETFLHDDESVALIKEAVSSDAATMKKDLGRVVEILFQENVELYPVSIIYGTAVINPALHDGNINVGRSKSADWHLIWKEAN